MREKQAAVDRVVRQTSHAGEDFAVGFELWAVAAHSFGQRFIGFDFVGFEVKDGGAVRLDHHAVEGAGEPFAIEQDLEAFLEPADGTGRGTTEDGPDVGR